MAPGAPLGHLGSRAARRDDGTPSCWRTWARCCSGRGSSGGRRSSTARRCPSSFFLALAHEVEDREGLAHGLEVAAALATATGAAAKGGRLLAAAAALREAIGAPLPPVFRPEVEQVVEAGRAAIGADGFAAARTGGRDLTVEQAVREATTEATLA